MKNTTAVIYNRSVISKAEARAESENALKKFLKSGGVIEVVKSRKAPKPRMSSKTSRNSSTGTSGFAIGYPTRSGI